MRRIILILFLSSLIPLITVGQDTTSASTTPASVIKPITKTFTENDIQFNLPALLIDTFPGRQELFTPSFRSIVYNDLGNVGLPLKSLVFNQDKQIGFNYAFNPYELYFINPTKTPYINTRAPFTDMSYTQGGGELLMLRIKHAQNILPRWNVGVELNRITSQGFLLKQYSSFYGVNAFTSYFSKEKHYILLGNITWNYGLNEESGGVRSDSSFESLTGGQKGVYTNLANSETHYRNRSAYVKQYYRWGKSEYIGDDSIYDFKPTSQLVYTMRANQMSYAFNNKGDTSSLFLPNRYYDETSTTYDSMYFGKLTNQLEYQVFGADHSTHFLGSEEDSIRTQKSGGIRYELINVAQPVFVRQFANIILDGSYDVVSLKDNRSKFHIGGSYVLKGYNDADYKLELSFKLKYKYATLLFAGFSQYARPDFFYQLYKSNQFIWENYFKQTSTQMLSVGFRTNKFRNNLQLVFKTQIMNNFVYLNELSRPVQESGTTTVNTIELNKTIQIWKIYLEHLVYYQKSSSNNIRLPELAGIARYYFQSKFFGISRFQIGFNVIYNTAYYGNGFNPSMHQFILQNDVKIGNYPVINPFFVGEIKRASIFAMYEHVNMDLIKSGMYTTAHYPIGLSNFRMGVRWRLYD